MKDLYHVPKKNVVHMAQIYILNRDCRNQLSDYNLAVIMIYMMYILGGPQGLRPGSGIACEGTV